MKKFLSFSPEPAAPANQASTAPEAVGPAEPVLVLGQTDQERVEAHIQTLRRFTELALMAAERLNAREAARSATAATEAVAEPGPSDDKISVSIHRFARTTRFNIALEQKLIDDLRNPGPKDRAAKPGSRQRSEKQAQQDAQLAERKAEIERFVENYAATDATLDRERYDELLDELRHVLGSGRLDETILAKDPKTVGYLFMLDNKVSADWGRIIDDATVTQAEGKPDPTYPPPPWSASPPPPRSASPPPDADAAEPEPTPDGTDPKAQPP
jgi:hypothetical protein